MDEKKQHDLQESETESIECEHSSGNVFADLGIENAEEELEKAKKAWMKLRKLLGKEKELSDYDNT